MSEEQVKALERIESMLEDGYVDITDDFDEIEVDIITEAITLYKEKYKIN